MIWLPPTSSDHKMLTGFNMFLTKINLTALPFGSTASSPHRTIFEDVATIYLSISCFSLIPLTKKIQTKTTLLEVVTHSQSRETIYTSWSRTMAWDFGNATSYPWCFITGGILTHCPLQMLGGQWDHTICKKQINDHKLTEVEIFFLPNNAQMFCSLKLWRKPVTALPEHICGFKIKDWENYLQMKENT